MFEFIYKMFGEGLAVIPKRGMGAIPEQLAAQLKTTNFRFNTAVKQVLQNQIILKSGEKIDSHFTIIASEASELVSKKGQEVIWKSCHNFRSRRTHY